MPPEKKKPARVWPVLRAYVKAVSAYPFLLSAAILGVVIIQIANVAAPLYLRQFINVLAVGTASPAVLSTLFWILAAFAGVNLFGWFGERVRAVATTRAEARTMADLFNTAFHNLLGHSHEFFISNFTGTLTRRVTRYARSFEQVFDNLIFNFLPALLFAGGVITILWQKHTYLGAGLLAWTVFFVYIQYKTVAWLQPLRTARTEEDSRVTGTLSDAVLNHSTITTFAALGNERTIFGAAIGRWYEATKRAWDADMWVNAVQGILAIIIEVALLSGAVFLWREGSFTVGDFVLIQVYILGLFNQIWGIGRNMRQLYDAFADATEMLDIIELPHGIRDAPNALPLTEIGRAHV